MPVTNTPSSTAISVAEATMIVLDNAMSATAESLPLQQAVGGVLREDIQADRDFPPFDRVTMDGIAIAYEAFERGVRVFSVEGVQAAGVPGMRLKDRAGCIEVMTGAVLPAGCDCVIPVEELRRADESVEVMADAEVALRQYVHLKGSDHLKGEVLLSTGTLLRSPEVAVCATVGKTELLVARRPSVAVVSTGDELVEVGQEPGAHQIRISNSYAVEAALSRSGRARTERFHAPDDKDALKRLFANLIDRFDLLVVSGGVSAGRFDLVPPVLESLGVRTLFHRVKQRPGYPLLFGVSSEGKAVFALPGNPVSTLVSTHRYIIPFLEKRSGVAPREAELAVLAEDYRVESPRTLFLPVSVDRAEDGRLLALPVALNGSGDLAGITNSDGFLELPADTPRFAAGSAWPLTRWK